MNKKVMYSITDESIPVTTKDKIGQIVQSIPDAEALFKIYGLDCNRRQDESLRAVCFQNKWDEEFLLGWIWDEYQWNERLNELPEEIPGKGTAETSEAITKKYYQYITDRLTRIQELFEEIQTLHGNQYTQLKTMKWYVRPFVEKLRSYIDRMQTHLFSMLKKQSSFPRAEKPDANSFDTILVELKRERKELLNLSDILIQKSNEFKNPRLACTRHRVLNYYLDTVCSMMQEQFDAENEYILTPCSRNILNDNNELHFSTKK